MRNLAKLATEGQASTASPHLSRCAFQSPGGLRKALWSHDIKAPNRYETAVALTVAAHGAFIGYVVVGGFVALRWRRSFWLHVPAGVWAMTTIVKHLPCPLTDLESWARAKAGMPALPPDNGFVARYIDGVIYPASWMGKEVIVFVMVLLSWILYAWRGLRRNGVREEAG